jgi:hypothetical protein
MAGALPQAVESPPYCKGYCELSSLPTPYLRNVLLTLRINFTIIRSPAVFRNNLDIQISGNTLPDIIRNNENDVAGC